MNRSPILTGQAAAILHMSTLKIVPRVSAFATVHFQVRSDMSFVLLIRASP